jgi:hypothetical protein
MRGQNYNSLPVNESHLAQISVWHVTKYVEIHCYSMSDSLKFQAKFPDIALRGILKGYIERYQPHCGLVQPSWDWAWQIYKRKTTGTGSVSCTEINRSQTVDGHWLKCIHICGEFRSGGQV